MSIRNDRSAGGGWLRAAATIVPLAVGAALLVVACGGGGGGGGSSSSNGGGRRSPTPTPTPIASTEFVYIANNAADLGSSVQPYWLSTLNGLLNSVGNITSGISPHGVAVTNDGKSCFATNNGDNTVSVYAIGGLGSTLSVAQPPQATGVQPNGIAVFNKVVGGNPQPVALYVANTGDGTISQFSISSGMLTAMTPPVVSAGTSSGSKPFGLAISPGGMLYVTLQGENNVQQFSINATTGALTSGPEFPTSGAAPQGIAVTPNGLYLYTANSGEAPSSNQHISGFSINPVTGALTSIAEGTATGQQTVDLAIDSTSSFLYATNEASNTVSEFSISLATGALVSIGQANTGSGPVGIFTLNSTTPAVYVTNMGDDTVSMYNNDVHTGALTPQSPGAITTEQSPLAIAATINNLNDSNAAYAVNAGNNIVSEYSVSTSNGALSPGGAAAVGASGAGTWGVAADPLGRFVYATNFTDDTLGQMVINPDGSLDANPNGRNIATSTGDGLQEILVDPTGHFVYVVETTGGVNGSGAILQLSINPDGTLNVTSTAATNAQPSSITIDSAAQNLYVTEVGTGNTGGDVIAFTINPANGSLTSVGQAASGKTPVGIAVAPGGGFVYAANSGDSTITGFTRSSSNGALTPLTQTTSTGTGTNPQGLAAVAIGSSGFLYVANSAAGNIGQFAINSDGSLTALTPPTVASASSLPNLMTVDPAGRFLYVTSNNASKVVSEFAINPDGTLTLLGMASTGDGPKEVAATIKAQ